MRGLVQPVEVECRDGIHEPADEYQRRDVAEHIRIEVPVLKLLLLLLSQRLPTHPFVDEWVPFGRGNDQAAKEGAGAARARVAPAPCSHNVVWVSCDGAAPSPFVFIGCPVRSDMRNMFAHLPLQTTVFSSEAVTVKLAKDSGRLAESPTMAAAESRRPPSNFPQLGTPIVPATTRICDPPIPAGSLESLDQAESARGIARMAPVRAGTAHATDTRCSVRLPSVPTVQKT